MVSYALVRPASTAIVRIFRKGVRRSECDTLPRKSRAGENLSTNSHGLKASPGAISCRAVSATLAISRFDFARTRFQSSQAVAGGCPAVHSCRRPQTGAMAVNSPSCCRSRSAFARPLPVRSVCPAGPCSRVHRGVFRRNRGSGDHAFRPRVSTARRDSVPEVPQAIASRLHRGFPTSVPRPVLLACRRAGWAAPGPRRSFAPVARHRRSVTASLAGHVCS